MLTDIDNFIIPIDLVDFDYGKDGMWMINYFTSMISTRILTYESFCYWNVNMHILIKINPILICLESVLQPK